MKKLLTFLTLLTLSIGVTWAATVTYTTNSTSPKTWPTSGNPRGITTDDGFLLSIDKGSGNNGNNSSDYVQILQKNTFTVSHSSYTITEIKITGSTNNYAGRLSSNVGTCTLDGAVTTWSGNSKTVVFTANNPSGTPNKGQLRMTSIQITYDDGGSTPTTYSLTLPTGLTGGTVTSNYLGDLTKIASGTSITVTATPATGYTLEYMRANGTEVQNPYTFAIAENTTITAAFEALQTYAITVTNGKANPTSAYEGQTVTLTPTIPDGKVVDWDNTTVSPSSLEINHSDYTFTMPGEAVTVNFAFKDAPNESTATLTNANIVDAGAGQDGYSNWTLTDENGKTWNAYAIKKAHSNATSSYHFLQIKKSTNTESSFIQVPEYGTKITKLEMTVSGASQAMTSGGNTATLFFSSSNSTSSIGTGIASGTGSSKVTIDCSNLNLNTGYITSSGAVRIWDVKVFFEDDNPVQSNDLYIVGQVNGNDEDPIDTSEGVKLNYNQTNDIYTVDFYCKGMSDGYSYFLFAKSLPFDWNNTSNLYGSGADNSYWPISGLPNESAFDEEIPLYENSKNVYRLPAGLYTVTVDLDYTGHQYTTKSVKVTKRDVIMTISPNSATFETTKNVTMSSNLTEIGGKIYYTTNGNDPRDPNSGRIEYTGELTINATTTFKAVAFIGNLYSEVVEKTYTKTPAAPVITPNGGTIYEATQVTITAEEGATIYYTTDGSTPTSENGTLYEGPFTVSATTTVKARAYVGDVYSSVTTAEFTYSDVQPSTGDFVLVTSASQLVAGNEYIIMTKDPTDYTLAMGDIVSSKGSWTQEFDINGNVGATGSTVSVYSESTSSSSSLVNILELENTNGQLSLKQQSAGKYLNITSSSSTDISASSSKTYLTIAIDAENYWATIQGTSSRQILFSGQNDVFGNYATSNADASNFSKVYLYTRESNSVQPPVFTPAGGVYDVPVDVTISCATTGASIYYTTDGTEPSATNGTLYNGEEFLVSETTTYKAVAVKNGNTSSVVTAEYTIAPHTAIETVTLDYREPFTAGIGKFTVQNVSGFAPVWTLDGAYGIKGTSYSANTNPTNNAAVSRFLSPIIDMTDATQPELTFSHQINSYFTDVTNQCQLFIRETTNGTDGTWVQLPITFSDPVAAGGWTNDVVDIDLSTYAGKKVQISFLYTNPEAGSGAGTWEIQNFVVADNSEYKMVNNIAEFLALENGTKAKFRNPVTVLYDYAQHSSNSYHEYIWVKDESGYMQFYLIPTLNSDENSDKSAKAAYYENGDIIPAGFVVIKNYYEDGKFVQAYSADALEAGFLPSTQKGLADPEYMAFGVLDDLDASNTTDVANWSNHYITLEKIKLTSSSKSFNFQDENGNVNACVGYNKYNGDGSLLKDGTTSANVLMPTDLTKFYNVKGIIQLWKGDWEFMPIEFTEWKPKEVTLRKLCADGVEQNTYTISNPLQVVYVDTKSNSVWVKDGTGQSIWSTSPEAPNAENFAIEYASNTRSQQAYYDQSNWCQLVFDDEIPTALANLPIINGGMITGKFTNKMNPTLENVELGENFVQTESSSYATNYYMAANFNGPQLGYFFMNPKPQEYADIVWAIYDSSNQTMIMTNNSNKNPEGFEGSFKINMSMNINPSLQLVDGTQTGKGYEHFHAIIRLTSSATSNAPMLKDRMPANTEYVVYPLDITQDVPTGITDVNGKAVKSVKYVNVAGVVSDKPFSGVNIVVTEYTDGSRTTSKMLRK